MDKETVQNETPYSNELCREKLFDTIRFQSFNTLIKYWYTKYWYKEYHEHSLDGWILDFD